MIKWVDFVSKEKTVLIVANAASMVRLFNEDNIQILLDEGYRVHIACNFEKNNTFPQERVEECIKEWTERGFVLHQFPTDRSPFSLNNLKAYFVLRKLLKEKHFDLIHCHAPISSAICRLVANKYRKKGTKIMYTAHGFHFFKGAPFINWLIYFPIEWICSFFTDIQVTINAEDFAFAKKHLHAKNFYYTPGVGVDTNKFSKNFSALSNKEEVRASLGIPYDSALLISVGELIKRKNHCVMIEALSKIENEKVHYIIVGQGGKKDELEELARTFGVSDRVHLLGFRSDVCELCCASDIFCFPSLQEGLPVALMEAMSVGLPCVASNIRGNEDLIEDGENGFLCDCTDVNAFADKISILVEDEMLRTKFGALSAEKVKNFSIENVNEHMKRIYLTESDQAELVNVI